MTESSFAQEVVERSREVPVVVDFWAEWCQPCHMLTPVLERAVGEREGRVELVKVDVDENPRLADEFAIRGIPAVKAFKNGTVVREFVGVQSPASVDAFLDALFEPSEGERLLAELRESGEETELVAALEADDYERAFEQLLGQLEGAGEERRDRIRQIMVALFEELGQEHPLSVRYRRRLAASLY